LTITLIALALLAAWIVVRSLLRRRAYAAQWHVVTRTRADGTRCVVLAGPGGRERVTHELPAALEGIALEDALLSARSQAYAEAMRLNDPPVRAPAPRTRS
jgi:hypothetical protein